MGTRALAAAAVTGLAAVGLLLPAGSAAAATPPADCTLSSSSIEVWSMTCTARPAAQSWRVRIRCFPFGRMVTRYGNTVTGNGTSTASCGFTALEAFDPQFELV